ncbi:MULTISPECIES: DUF2892 domain-containing protein [Pseudomonas]|uniref:YgaP family membrane protein n=1 Tax=Pseudomonas TaxID=286 RepID=UPI0003C5914D|nr:MULTISPECIES: DUF2892 domain-containing protein [Pseudomonas]EST15213.1 hypothetical protein EDP1_3580 [Pseudomonas putida S610]MBI6926190.1 DUF2892 domain-containing protein [Pseudomonas putida]
MLDNHADAPLQEKNVHGIERATSLAGGVLLVGKGLSQGGIVGLFKVAVGGLALVRGFTGHCATKAWLEQRRDQYDQLKSDLKRTGDELTALKDSAKAATEGVTVTGKDPVAGV